MLVQLRHVRSDGEASKQVIPIGTQVRKSGIHLRTRSKGIQHRAGRSLVDDAGGLEFGFGRILDIPQYEDQFFRSARSECQIEPFGRNRAPAMGYRVRGCTCQYLLGRIETVVQAQESLPVGVEAVEGTVRAVEGIVVPPFAVFSLMKEDVRTDFHFPGREVTLEIFHVRGGIPQAPFDKSIQLDLLRAVRAIGQFHPMYLASLFQRDKEKRFGTKASFLPTNAGIAHSMAAFIKVQRRLARLPARIPDRIAVLDVEIAATSVHGNAIVAIAQDPPELGVPAETIAAGRIGNQGKEIPGTHIVDPGPGGMRPGYDIFARSVVKMSVAIHLVNRQGFIS